MKLKAWLKKSGVSYSRIGTVVGVSSQLIYQYVHEICRPSLENIKKIEIFTDGEVSFDDFLKQKFPKK